MTVQSQFLNSCRKSYSMWNIKMLIMLVFASMSASIFDIEYGCYDLEHICWYWERKRTQCRQQTYLLWSLIKKGLHKKGTSALFFINITPMQRRAVFTRGKALPHGKATPMQRRAIFSGGKALPQCSGW